MLCDRFSTSFQLYKDSEKGELYRKVPLSLTFNIRRVEGSGPLVGYAETMKFVE